MARAFVDADPVSAGKSERGGDRTGKGGDGHPAGAGARAGGLQQRVDGALRIGPQRTRRRGALGGECVECGLLTLDALLGGGLRPDGEGQRRVEHQTRHLVRMRGRVRQRHLCAVAHAEQGQCVHVPGAAQPLDVLGGVGVVVRGVPGGDRVGAHGGRGLSDRAQVGDGIVTGFELCLLEHLPAVGQVAAVEFAGHPHAAAVHRDDRMAS